MKNEHNLFSTQYFYKVFALPAAVQKSQSGWTLARYIGIDFRSTKPKSEHIEANSVHVAYTIDFKCFVITQGLIINLFKLSFNNGK